MVGVGHVKVLERARVATGWFYAAAGAQSRWVRVRPLPAAAHALQERGSFVLAPAPVLSTMARVFKLPLVALALRAAPAEVPCVVPIRAPRCQPGPPQQAGALTSSERLRPGYRCSGREGLN